MIGPALGLLVLVKLLDLGFFIAFDRPFNPVDDWSYASIGVETMRDTFGRTDADLAVAGAVLLGVAALVLPTLAVLHLTRVAARHRRRSLRAVAALTAAWVVCWAFGAAARLGREHRVHERGRPGRRRGACRAIRPPRSSALQRRAPERPLSQHARRPAPHRPPRQGRPARVRRELREARGRGILLLAWDRRRPRRGNPAARRRRLLRPKRVAHVLDLRRRKLAGARHAAVGCLGRQPRAATTSSSRATASRSRRRSGEPGGGRSPTCRRTTETGRRERRSTTTTRSTTAGTSGIAARSTRFASMPDQYVLLALQRLELAKPHRRPIFSEIDLVSSHTPWTRIPPPDRLEPRRRRVDLQPAARSTGAA